jgi:hypothetical protein
MARNLGSIRSDARSLLGQPDSTNSNFTNAELDIWANEGIRDICIELETGTITERKYTTANSVTLNTATVSIDTIKFLVNDGTSTSWKVLKPIDIADLALRDPDWENATAGTPDYAVKFGQFDMTLHPPLDTNNISQAEGLKTYGLELPSTLSDDTDETPFAHHIDDLVAHYVAYRGFAKINEQGRSTDEFRQYRGRLKQYKKTATQWSKGRNVFRWTQTDGSARRGLQID